MKEVIEIKMEIPKKLYNFLQKYCDFTGENIDNLLKNMIRGGLEAFFDTLTNALPFSIETLKNLLNDF